VRKKHPLPDDLRELLNYDPETGLFTWKKPTGRRAKVGARAGAKEGRGYRVIGIRGRNYKEHRLAWKWVYGVDPEEEIDHKNGVKTDNWIKNLREATSLQNKHNSSICKHNKSGFKGVYKHSQNGNWVANTTVNHKHIHIGVFKTPEEASEAYNSFIKGLQGQFYTSR